MQNSKCSRYVPQICFLPGFLSFWWTPPTPSAQEDIYLWSASSCIILVKCWRRKELWLWSFWNSNANFLKQELWKMSWLFFTKRNKGHPREEYRWSHRKKRKQPVGMSELDSGQSVTYFRGQYKKYFGQLRSRFVLKHYVLGTLSSTAVI